MKKAISLILVLVLCLSLTACGEGNLNDNEPTLDQTLSPPDKFTEPSMDVTDPFIDSPSEPSSGSTESDDLPVIGETKLMSMRERDDRPRTIELHENNTCTVDEKTYQWKVEPDSQLIEGYYVAILEGNTELYRVEFAEEPGITLVKAGENEYIYLDLSVYEKVELTVENWDTYFEYKEEFFCYNNAFGEFNNAEIDYRYDLKEEYFARLYNNNGSQPWYNQDEVTIEYQYAYNWVNYGIDVQQKTYTIEEITKSEVKTYITESYQGTEDYFRLYVGSVNFFQESGNASGYQTNVSILRVKGHLWLKKQ